MIPPRCAEEAMSALGQKQTLAPFRVMSALPPKADMVLHRQMISLMLAIEQKLLEYDDACFGH
jgi:hypothetical protein